MIKVTFFRGGSYINPNYSMGGKFQKEFSSLDEFVRFIDISRGSLYVYDYNLSKKQRKILRSKINSFMKKKVGI